MSSGGPVTAYRSDKTWIQLNMPPLGGRRKIGDIRAWLKLCDEHGVGDDEEVNRDPEGNLYVIVSHRYEAIA